MIRRSASATTGFSFLLCTYTRENPLWIRALPSAALFARVCSRASVKCVPSARGGRLVVIDRTRAGRFGYNKRERVARIKMIYTGRDVSTRYRRRGLNSDEAPCTPLEIITRCPSRNLPRDDLKLARSPIPITPLSQGACS